MSGNRGIHKVSLRAMAQWAKAAWTAGSTARREHAMAVWGDGADADWRPRPDHLYRRVRVAYSPKAEGCR